MVDHETLEVMARARMADADRQARLYRLRRADRPGLRSRVARQLVDAAGRLDPAASRARAHDAA